jgi:hypothetical protein
MFMAKLIISTTGTTLFFVPDVVTAEEKTLLTRHANETNPPEALQALIKSVDNDPRYQSMSILKTAEFATLSLYRSKVRPDLADWYIPGVRYGFIGSDTFSGRMVTSVFNRFLNAHYKTLYRCDDIIVKGLQVGSAIGLDTALRELYATLDRLTAPYDHEDVLFNISGGFKFVSGWVQGYAIHRGFATVYTFEGSNEMILTEPLFPGDFPPRLSYI